MSSNVDAQMNELADKIGVLLANGIEDGEATDDDCLAALQMAIELSESALMNMTDIAQRAEHQTHVAARQSGCARRGGA